jgi:serine/threonine protein kinase
MSILGKYQIINEIGRGKFGAVYKGARIKDGEPVAIKIETVRECKILNHEATILNFLYRNGCKSTPVIFWYGLYQDYPTLIMPYYTCPLNVYCANNDNHIVLSKLLRILGNVHKCGVIHRDIKPENIMVKGGEFYFIDFGLATFYLDENYTHVPFIDSREYILGTPKYISYNVHLGIEPSRRDDLISLGYMMLSFCCELPWTNILCDETLYAKNHIMHPVNLERRRLKSWSNLVLLFDNNESIRHILTFLDKCYQLKYDETIEHI